MFVKQPGVGAVFKASILKLRWMLAHIFFLMPLWPYLGSYIILMKTGAAAGQCHTD